MQAHDFIDVNFGSKLDTGNVHIVFEVKKISYNFSSVLFEKSDFKSFIRDLKTFVDYFNAKSLYGNSDKFSKNINKTF